MDLLSEWIHYDSPAGAVNGFLARPRAASGALPGVIVIQEIWGVDGHISDLVLRLAGAGYLALAPDLYSAGGARPDVLNPQRIQAGKEFLNTIPTDQWGAVLGDPDRRAQALSALPSSEAALVAETLTAIFSGIGGDTNRHISVLRAAFQFLHHHPSCQGRPIGSIGFCLGGGLSALLASHEPQLACAVIFYGSSPSAELTASIRCPIRGFYGHDDPRILSTLPAFQEALGAAGIEHELRIYPNTGHAFFNDTRPSYRPEAARDAWGHTLAFFARTLGRADTIAL